jgi:hypothetical protein
MTAVWYRFRAELRDRWLVWLATADAVVAGDRDAIDRAGRRRGGGLDVIGIDRTGVGETAERASHDERRHGNRPFGGSDHVHQSRLGSVAM